MKAYTVLFVSLLFLLSCKSGLKKEGEFFIGNVELKNGASEQKEVSYKVNNYIVEQLKLDKQKLDDLIKQSMVLAKNSLKNPYTFDYLPVSESSCSIYSTASDSTIKVFVDYIGQNGFGVKSKSFGTIEFDKSNFGIVNSMFL